MRNSVAWGYGMWAVLGWLIGSLPAEAQEKQSAFADDLTIYVSRPVAYVNRRAVTRAVAQAVSQVVPLNPTTSYYVPVVANTEGDLANSVLVQYNGLLGIGTKTPSTLLTVSSSNPTLRVENISDVAGDSPNFNFYSSHGTVTSPTRTQNGDNLGQFAAAGYNGAAFPGSKAKINFVATEDWTLGANGTALTFATTMNGSTVRSERMRIDQSGYVGIGTSTPSYPLDVNGTARFSGAVTVAAGLTAASDIIAAGVIRSSVGGFQFPDGTMQTTSAVSSATVISVTAADSSITVGGSATAPTLKVNPASVQTRVTGSCASGQAVSAIAADGTVSCVSTVATGVPQIVASVSFTGSYGVGSSNTLYTASADGFYRVSIYMNTSTVGSCASTPCAAEAITVQWNDGVATIAQATAYCNLVTPCGASYMLPLWLKSGQAISAYGQSYGVGSEPSGGSYTAYIRVEQL